MSERILNLNQAIYEIKEALSERNNPFYFIVGAGISYDSIPLAKDIIELCKNKIKQSNATFNLSENLSGAEEYSFWLEKAYPQPISRQRFFRTLIENKNITPANFRLAHLLAYSKLGNIVVTPNFDDFLARALNHFNVKHITCDHPDTAFKVNSESEDIQIVHVHGSYLSYDCCNLTPEIIARNKGSEITTNTMASLLERIGESISPLVIGYSGWENDVIMTSLRKRLQSRRLPYNLYWFCYSYNALNNLPQWLKEHNDIVFVIPEKNSVITKHDDHQDKNEHIIVDAPAKLVIQNEPTLSAHIVFDRLVNALDLPEPEITQDPINFLIKFIGGSSEKNESMDVFFLGHVIDRLKNLKRLEKENDGNDDQNVNLFKNIRGFARRSQYITAARLLQQLNYENFNHGTLLELLQVIFSIISNTDKEVDENYELTLSAFTYLEDIVQKVKIKDAKFNIAGLLVLAYDLKAGTYNELDDEENYLNTLDKLIDLANDVKDPKLQYPIAHAMYNRAISLKDVEVKHTLQIFNELIEKFDKIDNITPIILTTAYRLITIYINLNDFDHAHRICDYLVTNSDRLGEETEALGLFGRLRVLIEEGKVREACLTLETFESKFSVNEKEFIQELLLDAIELCTENSEDTDPQALLAINNKIIGLFRNSKSEKVQARVSDAYISRAFYYYQKGDSLTAADNFMMAFELGETLAGINLFYLIRKKEILPSISHYNMEELITPKLDEKDPFALINQALNLIQNDSENWQEADTLISQIGIGPIKTNEVKDWWHNLSISGDAEGDLVLAWLIRHNLINDPESLSLRDRLEKTKMWEVPEFMFNYAN
ncbi:SIR2-like domain-containing protein [Peribacillus simplex]|uniref:SIR2-like domain-containing protein n=1 Tax=Peribacillus simplex TaxID=1478 RepID=A0A9X8WLG9_9BACI|nr:SIR2 family protein [Peribacillus simplex]SIR68643.1 SIR2-like domain-containing protein [Peribacillus simplex]